MYPIEKLPVNLVKLHTALPVPPHKPSEPIAPRLPEFNSRAEIIDLFPLAVITTFVVSLFFVFWNSYPLANILAYISFIIILFGFKCIFGQPLIYFKHQKDDKIRFKESVDFYNGCLIRHNTVDVPNYPRKVNNWKSEIVRIAKPDYVKKYQLDSVKAVLGRSGIPVQHPKKDEIKKGAFEGSASEFLLRNFPGKVYIGGTAKNDKGEVGRWTPLPDFVVHDKNIGYNLVIEIDEPYDLQYGYPIHCSETDNERDNYFLQQNWLVLRFAEIQWVQQPEYCCDYIAKFINEATLGLSELTVSGAFRNINHVKCWNKDEALEMEAAGTREAYLPIHLLGDTFNGSLYKEYGPQIRKKRREDFIAQELEREVERVQKLKRESDESWLRTLRRKDYDDENDLPF